MDLLLLAAVPLSAAPSFHTVLAHGPVSNRFNVVFLAEGYTAAELGRFLVEATNATTALLAQAPYREYQTYLNAFAIAVPSVESGSDHPARAVVRNTYFNSTYDAVGDYVITIDAAGVASVNALLQQFLPAYDLVVLLVNDPIRGGSGGPRIITSTGATWEEVLVHESGHTVGRLGDEYDYSVPGFDPPNQEFPNVTAHTQRALIPWNAWIDPGTPVPTPADWQYLYYVGLFAGANYSPTGWYRPTYDGCIMRVPFAYARFCDVCREALVRALYEQVRLVDSAAPAATHLTLATPAPVEFSVSALQPEGSTVVIQWGTNGVPVPGATHSTFSLSPLTLGDGTHTVQALLHDATPFVRVDPGQRLRQVLTWNIQVRQIQLQLAAPRHGADGACSFQVTGNASGPVVIQGSSNLVEWLALQTNWLVGGSWSYTNTTGSNLPCQFFRAVTAP